MGPKIAEVSADAVYGEQVKKKTMSPAVFGRHGAFGVSAGKGAMAADRVPSCGKSISMASIAFSSWLS